MKISYKPTCLLAVLTLSAAFAVSQQPATSPTQDPKQPGARPPQSSQLSSASSSADAQSKIETVLRKDPSLARAVTVKVTDRKVVLSGEVASNAAKEKAQSIAEANASGRQVENNIWIKLSK